MTQTKWPPENPGRFKLLIYFIAHGGFSVSQPP